MSDMTSDKAAELRRPFPPTAIGKLPKGGTQLDYVGHAATTDRLLSVDPAWNYEIVSVDGSGNPLRGLDRGMWIRLTVCGVTRYGYGDGGSVKEAIGDAIRNAAMRFGVALDLWSKEELEQASGPAHAPAAAPTPAADVDPGAAYGAAEDSDLLNTRSALARAMYASFNDHGITADGSKAYMSDVLGRDITSSKELTVAEARQVLDALKRDTTAP